MAYITGKQAFLQILKQEGVSVMFGNPGTNELPLMARSRGPSNASYQRPGHGLPGR
jgi:thiamine pyrophosphate-dependent acetolactate synthase large subunit-like protein